MVRASATVEMRELRMDMAGPCLTKREHRVVIAMAAIGWFSMRVVGYAKALHGARQLFDHRYHIPACQAATCLAG